MKEKESRKKVDRKSLRKQLKAISKKANVFKQYNDLWTGVMDEVFKRANELAPSDTGELIRSSFKQPIKKRGFITGFEIGYRAKYAADIYENLDPKVKNASRKRRTQSVYIQDSPAVRSHDRTYTGKGGRTRQTIRVNYPNGRVFRNKKRVVYWKGKDNNTGRRDGKHQFYTTDRPERNLDTGGWLSQAYEEIYEKTSTITRRLLGLPKDIDIRVNATSKNI